MFVEFVSRFNFIFGIPVLLNYTNAFQKEDIATDKKYSIRHI